LGGLVIDEIRSEQTPAARKL